MFVCAGMGFNMVTLASFVIVQQHFKKFRALAAAIAACGISLGSLCAGPLLTAMLNAYQYRGTLLLISGMVLNTCVFGALYRPPPTQKYRRHQKSSSPDDSEAKNSGGNVTLRETLRQLLRDLTNWSLFSNAPFTLVCFGSFMMNLGLMVFMQHTPSRAVKIGFTHKDAYMLQTVTGVAVLVGRIAGGITGNLSCTNRLLQYGVGIIAGGLVQILLGNLFTYVPLALFGAAAGLFTGMQMLCCQLNLSFD